MGEKKPIGPALCLTAIEAKLACKVFGARLPTPEEWNAALGGMNPAQLPKVFEKGQTTNIERYDIGEWTMKIVHGIPVFELKGADALGVTPIRLTTNGFSSRVGFRCVYSYGEQP